MSKVFTNAVVATAIIAFTEALKIDGQANDVRNMAIQKLLDVMTIKRGTQATKDFLKGNAITNPARAAVKQLFDTLVEKGLISTQTGKVYSTNFWIAFQDNVPFSPALSNQKSKAKKGAQTGNGLAVDKAVATKAGKVETTDRAALIQTLTKAFEQSQILIKAGDSQLTITAATLETLINEMSAPF
jgi:polyhydroxyalkanoate synthesis regulator phasin